jgi:SAM-dependent methyltransferase
MSAQGVQPANAAPRIFSSVDGSAAAKSVREPNYIFTDAAMEVEDIRLRLIEHRADPLTIGRLVDLGVASGWQCLEVGSGRGSIARWLAGQVGPEGHVVASDIDCRYLTDMPENVEVRTLDIRTDTPECGFYDLVHCRTVLIHVPDPHDALQRMATALKPGGLLLIEEADYGLYAFGGHPDAAWLTDRCNEMFAALAARRLSNPYLGRGLPGMLSTVGVPVEGGHVFTSVALPGEPAFEFERQTLEAAGTFMISAGIFTETDYAAAQAIWNHPSTVMTTASLISAWGHRS